MSSKKDNQSNDGENLEGVSPIVSLFLKRVQSCETRTIYCMSVHNISV